MNFTLSHQSRHLGTIFKFIYLFIYFLAVLGLRFCARAFSSCGERGPLPIALRGPLTIAASPVAKHRLQTRRFSSCGSRDQPLRGMWDPPGPGHEPVSPALAGGFPTTEPPGKPLGTIFDSLLYAPQFLTTHPILPYSASFYSLKMSSNYIFSQPRAFADTLPFR